MLTRTNRKDSLTNFALALIGRTKQCHFAGRDLGIDLFMTALPVDIFNSVVASQSNQVNYHIFHLELFEASSFSEVRI